jgi:hypothetical protein
MLGCWVVACLAQFGRWAGVVQGALHDAMSCAAGPCSASVCCWHWTWQGNLNWATPAVTALACLRAAPLLVAAPVSPGIVWAGQGRTSSPPPLLAQPICAAFLIADGHEGL